MSDTSSDPAVCAAECRRMVPVRPCDAAPARGLTLAGDLASDSVRRLAWLALLSMLAALSVLLLPLAIPSLGSQLPWWLIATWGAMSGATAVATFRGWVPPHRVAEVAALHQIAQSVVLAIAASTTPLPATPTIQLSPVVVLVLTGPVLVPMTTRRTWITALLSAAADPLAYLGASALAAVPVASLDVLAVRFFPTLLAIPCAVVLAKVVHGLGERVAEARSLGAYQLVERIGAGGMGEVWRASHERLARDAAVKLIRPESLAGADPAAVEHASRRFEREARAIASLRSPHTVQLYDSGVAADGTLFYVMELLDGVDLETLVREDGPQPVERVLHILRQMAHSLREAHARGLVHRDIKPANVMLTRYGEDRDHVKVLDFGLVRDVAAVDARMTADNAVAGTPAYLAPEMVASSAVDARADLYALGCTAYFLLTGELVFEGATSVALAVAHAMERPVPPSLRARQPIPSALDELILRCLEKSPARRPADVREVAEALARIEASLATPWTEARAVAWWADREKSASRDASAPLRSETRRAAWQLTTARAAALARG